MTYSTNYLALNYGEPGTYIPIHDPSYRQPTLEDAVQEANYDLKNGASVMSIYKLVNVVTSDGTVTEVTR